MTSLVIVLLVVFSVFLFLFDKFCYKKYSKKKYNTIDFNFDEYSDDSDSYSDLFDENHIISTKPFDIDNICSSTDFMLDADSSDEWISVYEHMKNDDSESC